MCENKTYHLCIEDKYLSYFISQWKYNEKPFPFTMRNAQVGVQGSFVVTIKDVNGAMFSFLATIVANTHAKIHVT